ncbi:MULTISPECIES: hypothetical protein [Pseudoalteromonas]|uniref:Uncharacterized protein n=1 Tax=Pseudoalteromonas amylolytica TaxID=1859457 RepID=A0A1S1MVA5_9GAMM|nr:MULTISPECIES: hypothetical protein [Pseudoalteromonas]OHU90574.1 hypothetical protein BFC16_02920 [Pseudoalteromonas sp. JW3]OHU92805.1 hypothetical protein BET10_04975 [Pseudoalteromonas amylolytica]
MQYWLAKSNVTLIEATKERIIAGYRVQHGRWDGDVKKAEVGNETDSACADNYSENYCRKKT